MSTMEKVRAKHKDVPSIVYIGNLSPGESLMIQFLFNKKHIIPDSSTISEKPQTRILHRVSLSPGRGLTLQRMIPPMVIKHKPKMAPNT
mmetsp:Transcript_59776/g.144020  ORF Transcript_59776/g.144020 Transcript_59776/m.144020 type:complete len:89 (-) Transcript_59776:312-578(-)